MSTVYTGSASGISSNPTITITEPSDGDARNAASVNTALSKLADYMAKISADYPATSTVYLKTNFAPSNDSGILSIQSSSWTSSAAQCSYYKDPSGRVWVSIKLTSAGTASNLVATLGVGYRPLSTNVPFVGILAPSSGQPTTAGATVVTGQADASGNVSIGTTPTLGQILYATFSFSTNFN